MIFCSFHKRASLIIEHLHPSFLTDITPADDHDLLSSIVEYLTTFALQNKIEFVIELSRQWSNIT